MYTAPAINFNIPGVPKACITGLPAAGVAIYQGEASQLIDFAEALRQALDPYSSGAVKFENIDVSKVAWDSLNFSVLADVLVEKHVTTKRFKAFKTGLDDDCMVALGDWFRSLPPAGLPSEIHLSHNKITKDGFDALFSIIEEKRAELPVKPCPVWLRVEMNSVPPDHVSNLAEEGRVHLCADIQSCRRSPGTAVAAMPPLVPAQWSAVPKAGQAQAQVVRPPAQVGTSPNQSGGAQALIRALQEKAALMGKGGLRPPGVAANFSNGQAGKGFVANLSNGHAGKGATAPAADSPMAKLLAMRQQIMSGKGGKPAAPPQVVAPPPNVSSPMVVAPPPNVSTPTVVAPPQSKPDAASKDDDDDDDSWGEWNKDGKKPASDPSEEKRVHPSDKSKQPYSYAGFIEFAGGDEAKAKRMWNESKPVQDSGNTSSNQSEKKDANSWGSNQKDSRSWDQKSSSSWNQKEDNSWNKKDDNSWQKKDDNSWQKKDDNSWQKKDDNSWQKKDDNSWVKKEDDRSWDKTDNRTWEQQDNKSWEKKHESSWGQKDQNSWEQKDSRSWEQKNGRSWEQNDSRSRPQDDARTATSGQVKAEEAMAPGRPAAFDAFRSVPKDLAEASLKRTAEESYKGSGVGAYANAPAPKVVAVPKAPQVGPDEEPPLPPGWTKEFSEEYKIPFYWNEETEETMWERPTA